MLFPSSSGPSNLNTSPQSTKCPLLVAGWSRQQANCSYNSPSHKQVNSHCLKYLWIHPPGLDAHCCLFCFTTRHVLMRRPVVSFNSAIVFSLSCTSLTLSTWRQVQDKRFCYRMVSLTHCDTVSYVVAKVPRVLVLVWNTTATS